MPFSIKLHACTGVPGHDASVNPDFRGGEPSDTHETVKLPGMAHGLELDPVDDLEAHDWLIKAMAVNKVFAELTGHLPQHLELRLMDSDGKV